MALQKGSVIKSFKKRECEVVPENLLTQIIREEKIIHREIRTQKSTEENESISPVLLYSLTGGRPQKSCARRQSQSFKKQVIEISFGNVPSAYCLFFPL